MNIGANKTTAMTPTFSGVAESRASPLAIGPISMELAFSSLSFFGGNININAGSAVMLSR